MIASLLIANRGEVACRIIRMARRLILAFLLTLVGASAAVATPTDRAATERVIRDLVLAQDGKDMGMLRDLTWADGYFSERSFAPDAPTTRRRWSDFLFGGIGINRHSRITRLRTRISGDWATAWVHEATRIDYGIEFSGVRSVSHNLVRLERRGSEWRVLSWDRRVRQYGSDAAWHRRHPR